MVHNGRQFPGAILSPIHFFCLGGGLRRERQDNCKNMDEKTSTENSFVFLCGDKQHCMLILVVQQVNDH